MFCINDSLSYIAERFVLMTLKCEFFVVQPMKAPGRMELHEVYLIILVHATTWSEWSALRSGSFTPRKRLQYPCVGPRTGMDPLEESHTLCLSRKWKHDSLDIQPLAWSLYRLSYSSAACMFRVKLDNFS
jgi:hypothetical protein